MQPRNYYVAIHDCRLPLGLDLDTEICVTSGAAVRFLVGEGLEYNAAEALVDLAYVHPGEDIVLRVGDNEYNISLR